MKIFILVVLSFGFVFSQVLEIESIIDPGNWINPESIFVSDNLYGSPAGNQDVITLNIADPIDTLNYNLNSVKVYLEQYVSDPTRAFWYVVPVINGTPGTQTPQQAGSLTDSVLCFDISADITGWLDLIGLDIGLYPSKGTGAPPMWYADYLYVAYTATGILEDNNLIGQENSRFFMPTIVHRELNFTYSLKTSTDISVEIYNTAGIKVFSKNIYGTAGENDITLKEVRYFSAGVYCLTVKTVDDQGVESGKFIVLH